MTGGWTLPPRRRLLAVARETSACPAAAAPRPVPLPQGLSRQATGPGRPDGAGQPSRRRDGAASRCGCALRAAPQAAATGLLRGQCWWRRLHRYLYRPGLNCRSRGDPPAMYSHSWWPSAAELVVLCKVPK